MMGQESKQWETREFSFLIPLPVVLGDFQLNPIHEWDLGFAQKEFVQTEVFTLCYFSKFRPPETPSRLKEYQNYVLWPGTTITGG